MNVRFPRLCDNALVGQVGCALCRNDDSGNISIFTETISRLFVVVVFVVVMAATVGCGMNRSSGKTMHSKEKTKRKNCKFQ